MPPMSMQRQEEAERQVDRVTLLKLLERAEMARTNQNGVVWTVVSLFAAAHAVLADALIEAVIAQTLHERAEFVLSVVGLALGIFGYALVDRGLRFMTFHEAVQRTIERDLEIPLRYTLSQESSALYRHHVRRSLPAKLMLRLLCLGAVAAWGWVVAVMAHRLR